MREREGSQVSKRESVLTPHKDRWRPTSPLPSRAFLSPIAVVVVVCVCLHPSLSLSVCVFFCVCGDWVQLLCVCVCVCVCMCVMQAHVHACPPSPHSNQIVIGTAVFWLLGVAAWIVSCFLTKDRA